MIKICANRGHICGQRYSKFMQKFKNGKTRFSYKLWEVDDRIANPQLVKSRSKNQKEILTNRER